jgi:hypothetical protein
MGCLGRVKILAIINLMGGFRDGALRLEGESRVRRESRLNKSYIMDGDKELAAYFYYQI